MHSVRRGRSAPPARDHQLPPVQAQRYRSVQHSPPWYGQKRHYFHRSQRRSPVFDPAAAHNIQGPHTPRSLLVDPLPRAPTDAKRRSPRVEIYSAQGRKSILRHCQRRLGGIVPERKKSAGSVQPLQERTRALCGTKTLQRHKGWIAREYQTPKTARARPAARPIFCQSRSVDLH